MPTPSEVSDRALFLSPEPPYPLTGGGAARSAGLLRFLARRYAVHLVTFRQPGSPSPASSVPAGLADPLTVIDLPYHKRGASARIGRNASRLLRGVLPLTDRFWHEPIRREVLRAIEGKRYAVAVIEHFWCAPYLTMLRSRADRVILDLHNIESVLHDACARTESWPQRAAHRRFTALAQEMEREWIGRFDLVLVPSEPDRRRVLDRVPAARVEIYPNAIPLRRQPETEEENVIAFSGNWEYHPNLTAVKFFKSRVWPRLRREEPELRWRLIGKNEAAIRRLVSGDTRIELTGPVEDPLKELAKARVVIAPLLSGSGTRVKILEAWAAGRAVVSTSIGAEGLPAREGENIRVADGEELFADAVLELLRDCRQRQRLGSEGRATYEQEGSWPAAWRAAERCFTDAAHREPAAVGAPPLLTSLVQ
jgi:glycosyltransferase involved in cell wall biosynthesis